MIYIAKGLPYKVFQDKENIIVWMRGKTYPLTEKQAIIWKTLYGKVMTFKELTLQIIRDYAIKYNIQKNHIEQILNQLIGMELISHSETEDKKDFLLHQEYGVLKQSEDTDIYSYLLKIGDTEVYNITKSKDNIMKTSVYRKVSSMLQEGVLFIQ